AFSVGYWSRSNWIGDGRNMFGAFFLYKNCTTAEVNWNSNIRAAKWEISDPTYGNYKEWYWKQNSGNPIVWYDAFNQWTSWNYYLWTYNPGTLSVHKYINGQNINTVQTNFLLLSYTDDVYVKVSYF